MWIYVDDNYWKAVADMSNLLVQQGHGDELNSHNAMSFKDTTGKELKSLIKMRIYMDYLCVKRNYHDYWQNKRMTSSDSLLAI